MTTREASKAALTRVIDAVFEDNSNGKEALKHWEIKTLTALLALTEQHLDKPYYQAGDDDAEHYLSLNDKMVITTIQDWYYHKQSEGAVTAATWDELTWPVFEAFQLQKAAADRQANMDLKKALERAVIAGQSSLNTNKEGDEVSEQDSDEDENGSKSPENARSKVGMATVKSKKSSSVLAALEKGFRPDYKSFPSLKKQDDWYRFSKDFKLAASVQQFDDVLTADFVPDSADAEAVQTFALRQKYVYYTLTKTVTEHEARSIVDSFAKEQDAQKAWKTLDAWFGGGEAATYRARQLWD